MDWGAIGAIGEILGGAAVLVTLLYVAKQIRQTNNISRFSTGNALTAKFDELNQTLLRDPELRRALKKREPLTEDEDEMIFVFADILANAWGSVEMALRADQIDEQLFELMSRDVEVSLMRWPPIRSKLDIWLDRYPDARRYRIFRPLRE